MHDPNGEPVRLAVYDLRPPAAPRGPGPAGEPALPDRLLSLVERLSEDGVLEVVAPFPPRALEASLRARGCAVEPEQRGDTWFVRVGKSPLPRLDELAELSPPEPAERVLAACAQLAPGAVYLALVPRTPRFLFPHLAARGLSFATAERPDGTALLWVRR